MSNDKKLAATPLAKLKIVWQPELYLMADGKKVSVETL